MLRIKHSSLLVIKYIKKKNTCITRRGVFGFVNSFFLQLNIYQYIIYFNEKLIKYITAAVRTVQIQVHCIA